MVGGIYTAAAGMTPRITQLDNVANNLANTTTSGFKRSSVFLRHLITAAAALDHANGVTRTEVPEDVVTDYSQGTFEATGRPFDLAINGRGFFRIMTPDGIVRYTRAGNFRLDPTGMLESDGGLLLDNNFFPIRIQGNTVAIGGDGTVIVDGLPAARIGLTDFAPADYRQLNGIGMGLFDKPPAVAESPLGAAAELRQGYLEDSNTASVRELVDMIELYRTFELGQRAITVQDQTLQRVVNEVGVVR